MMSLRSLGVALAIVLLGLPTFAVAGRLLYRFELEWMEGATVAGSDDEQRRMGNRGGCTGAGSRMGCYGCRVSGQK